MQGIKEYNLKIASLKNTMKLTSSMKMISTVKMQKFMKSSANSIPWWQATDEIFNNVNSILNKNVISLLSCKKEKKNKVLIYVISSDRGLCGRFNASVIEATEEIKIALEKKGLLCYFCFIGKKAARYFSKRKVNIINSYEIGKIHNFANFAKEISYDAFAKFINGEFDEIYLVRTKKLSTTLSKAVSEKILPLEKIVSEKTENNQNYTPLIETNKNEIAMEAIKYYLHSLFHMALVESTIYEHNARMMAMDSATTNCEKMIQEYIKKRNSARQTAITTEISEIISGKEAMSE